MVAAEAIKNVSRNLGTSIREPENIEAMSNVAFGSYLSGIQMTVEHVSAHILLSMRFLRIMRNFRMVPV